MKISCPRCGQSYDIDRTSIGKEADCTNCGNHFVIQATFSKPQKSVELSHCPYCAGEIVPGVKKCCHCGEWIVSSEKPQSHVVYVILAIFLGSVGIHNFVAGQKFSGVGKILLSMTALRMIFVFPHHWIGYLFFALNIVWIIADIVLFCQGKSVEQCLKHPQKCMALVGLLLLLIASLIYGEYYKLAIDSVESYYSTSTSEKSANYDKAIEIRLRVTHLPFANKDEVDRAVQRGIDDGLERKRSRDEMDHQEKSSTPPVRWRN